MSDTPFSGSGWLENMGLELHQALHSAHVFNILWCKTVREAEENGMVHGDEHPRAKRLMALKQQCERAFDLFVQRVAYLSIKSYQENPKSPEMLRFLQPDNIWRAHDFQQEFYNAFDLPEISKEMYQEYWQHEHGPKKPQPPCRKEKLASSMKCCKRRCGSTKKNPGPSPMKVGEARTAGRMRPKAGGVRTRFKPLRPK